MPKELIHSREHPSPSQVGPWPTVSVGWSREAEYVQVKVIDSNAVEAVRESEVVQLDRAALNAFIRTLRRARDQAFGVDE